MEQLLSTTEKTIDFNSSINQTIKGKFIGQHVYCNVNSLVEYCLKNGFEDRDSPVNYDDIENFYSYPEWQTIINGKEFCFDGGSDSGRTEFKNTLEAYYDEIRETKTGSKKKDEKIDKILDAIDTAMDEIDNLESEPQEVYEWWAVSEFLYSRLKQQGKVVIDSGSCYIWGRTTTGQAILLDGVISHICNDMEILDGQVNSWK